jgi:hypothetical protein
VEATAEVEVAAAVGTREVAEVVQASWMRVPVVVEAAMSSRRQNQETCRMI